MGLITLKAVKERLKANDVGITNAGTITMLFNPDGSHKATIPAHCKQPRKGQKEITINCFKYSLIWE